MRPYPMPSIDWKTVEVSALYKALPEVVRSLGGPKNVASRLWPSEDVRSAAAKLRNSLNPNTAQKLSLEEFFTLMRWAHDAGQHVAFQAVADVCGYVAYPISIEDELAENYRQAARLFSEQVARMQELEELAAKMNR